jgi:hypothetical protein
VEISHWEILLVRSTEPVVKCTDIDISWAHQSINPIHTHRNLLQSGDYANQHFFLLLFYHSCTLYSAPAASVAHVDQLHSYLIPFPFCATGKDKGLGYEVEGGTFGDIGPGEDRYRVPKPGALSVSPRIRDQPFFCRQR